MWLTKICTITVSDVKNYANYHESGQMFNEWRLRWLANSIAREKSCELLRRWLNIYSATLKQILLKLSEFYQAWNIPSVYTVYIVQSQMRAVVFCTTYGDVTRVDWRFAEYFLRDDSRDKKLEEGNIWKEKEEYFVRNVCMLKMIKVVFSC